MTKKTFIDEQIYLNIKEAFRCQKAISKIKKLSVFWWINPRSRDLVKRLTITNKNHWDGMRVWIKAAHFKYY